MTSSMSTVNVKSSGCTIEPNNIPTRIPPAKWARSIDRLSLILPMINASMEGLFGQNKEGRLDFPNGVYWCSRHGEGPHPNVEAFARRLGSNFRLLNAESLGTTG